MGSLFRSEEMTLCQLYLQADAAYAAVSQLGELGIMQFKDLNQETNVFQRKYVNEVRRCEEMERQLRYFEKELCMENMKPDSVLSAPKAPSPQEIVDFEATFETLESQLKEVSNNIEALARNYYELRELTNVLSLSQAFFETDCQSLETVPEVRQDIEMGRVQEFEGSRMKLEFVTGVINRDRLEPFMRLLWRACHGATFLRHTEISEDIHDITLNVMVKKEVFTVFFQGEQLRSRVRKICEGFRAVLYPCPETSMERHEMLKGAQDRIKDLDVVIQQSQEQRRRVLESITRNFTTWTMKVFKVKAIFHTLNQFRAEHHSFIAEGWCPVNDMDRIQQALSHAAEVSQTGAPSLIHRLPSQDLPTYHKLSKYTSAFQALIDAYGIATYQEVNPAPFAIITFPFLFSVMFGDAGHGMLLMFFGLWMLLKERSLGKVKGDNEIWNIFFGGRYMIFLMGLFSIYSGLIYNDIFSKSINVFGSSWHAIYDNTTLAMDINFQLDPNDTRVYTGTPYPFGLDPVWQTASNKITFTNSFKKKVSVVLGVLQMLFGVILSLANHIHFRRWLNIVSEFIPQILFLTCIFGYLCVLIFAKWIVFTPADSDQAPSLLIGLINMFMFKSVDAWFTGQFAVQITLVLLAGLCVPWMLLVKPLYLRWRHQVKKLIYMVDLDPQAELITESTTDSDTQILTDGLGGDDPASLATNFSQTADMEEEFDFGESLILQGIHTIEFCLGCISHTASYLRLWALSLAHAQLSEVLWTMVFRIGLSIPGFGGAIVTFVVFAPWAFLTVTILLAMEGLSAFLHTLRLHWVEFQSKFYKGEGSPFQPFDFSDIVAMVD